MMTFSILLFSILSIKSAAMEPQTVALKSKSTQLTIGNGNVAKSLFMYLPGDRYDADLVHGLIFKYHRYFFCVREPSNEFHCHLYLRDRGEGELSNYETDTDFGKGRVEDYLESKKLSSKTTVEIINGDVVFTVQGELAKRLFTKLDLVTPQYLSDDLLKYEVRNGKNIKCIRFEGEKIDRDVCKVVVPIKDKEKKIDLLD